MPDPVLLDDETDADFDYVAELSQAKDLEEQDEYRNDRAVHVSSTFFLGRGGGIYFF